MTIPSHDLIRVDPYPTDPNVFGALDPHPDASANVRPTEWIPYFRNPWVGPGTFALTAGAHPSNARDADRFPSAFIPPWADEDEWVRRSSESLHDWMDENPF